MHWLVAICVKPPSLGQQCVFFCLDNYCIWFLPSYIFMYFFFLKLTSCHYIKSHTKKTNWSIQGKHPLFYVYYWAMTESNFLNWLIRIEPIYFPKCFSVAFILFSFIQKRNMQESFLSKLEYKKVIKKSALTVLNTDGKNNHEESIVG